MPQISQQVALEQALGSVGLELLPITLELPADCDALDFLVSVVEASANAQMKEALYGTKDSLRQAALIPNEPLGLVACLTAEEEAASFLYYALIARGFPVKNYGSLRRHQDKIKVVIAAFAMENYFFRTPDGGTIGTIRIQSVGQALQASRIIRVGKFEIIAEDPLEMIVTSGDGSDSHEVAVKLAVEAAINRVVDKSRGTRSEIDRLANRRNLSLYGSPENKLKLANENGIEHYKNNCIAIIILGILVFNSGKKTNSLSLVVEAVFMQLSPANA